MTRFALAGKCGARGAVLAPSPPDEASKALRIAGKITDPATSERTVCRRVQRQESGEALISMEISRKELVDEDEIVRGQQHTGETRKCCQRALVLGEAGFGERGGDFAEVLLHPFDFIGLSRPSQGALEGIADSRLFIGKC